MSKPVPVLTTGVIKVAARIEADGAGSVALSWGALSGRLTPDEARACALSILLAAEAAETDEFLMQFAAQVAPADSRRPADWLIGEVQKLRYPPKEE